jgi:hypothetical protein
LSSVRGSSGIRLASSAAGVTAITADQINLNGTSSSQLGNGILLNATLATTNSSARNLTSTLQGVSASANSAYSGVEIDGNTRISAAAGTRISINAEASQTALISNGSSGVGISSNARLISSGHVSVKGLSYNASGLAVKTGATWTHNGADSTLLLAGSTTSNAAGVSLPGLLEYYSAQRIHANVVAHELQAYPRAQNQAFKNVLEFEGTHNALQKIQADDPQTKGGLHRFLLENYQQSNVPSEQAQALCTQAIALRNAFCHNQIPTLSTHQDASVQAMLNESLDSLTPARQTAHTIDSITHGLLIHFEN